MINVEFELFDEIAQAVRAQFPGIYITGEYVASPPSFPCVSFVETDNTTLERTQTNSLEDEFVTVTYEVNIYSNKKKGKKAECKEIAAFIDGLLLQRNFTRNMLQPIPNLADATIYRMIGRYRAVVGKDKTFYRR